MASSGSLSDIYVETLAVFDQTDHPHEPLTTPEVAESLDCQRRTVYKRLQTLANRGKLKTKKVGAGARVWWPADGLTPRSDLPGQVGEYGDYPSQNQVTQESIRVLHVDDDSSSAELVVEHLESEDSRIETVTAASVNAGLDILADQRIDCIVSDYEMPEMDGIDFLEAVREDFGDVPFILLTGKGSEEVAAEAIEAGVDSYHRKERGTGHYTVLANRIRNHVRQHRERARADRLEEEYALAAEMATDIFWVYDLKRETVKMDGLHRFGYDPSDIDTDFEWWVERLHPDDRERMHQVQEARLARDEDVFDELTAERGRFSSEYRFQRADGMYADCSIRGVLLFDDGEPAKMVGTMTDITDRKERERDLQQYKTITQTVSDVIMTIDTDSLIQEVNPAVAQVFGYDRTELLGKSLTTLMPDWLTDAHRDGIQRYLREGERNIDWEYLELPGVRADGAEVSLGISFSEYEHDGEQYFTGIIRDISERKERQEELELFQSLIDQSNDAVFVVDPDTGQFLDVNETACRRLGYSREKLLNLAVPDIQMDFSDWETWQSYVEELKAGGAMTFDGIHRRKDSSTFPVEVNDVYVELDQEYILAIARDVTERREREHDLKNQYEHLAALNSLNEVVTGITEAVIEQSTREEIEQVVCEQLAASDSYTFAWIAEAGPNIGHIKPRTQVGGGDYLNAVEISADPNQPIGQGPAGQTFRTGEMRASRNVFEDPAFGPWQEEAEQYGFSSFAAIPIVHEGMQYGVIGVYSERTGAFAEAEREVIGQLGEIIGHAIAAVDRERRYNAIFNQTFQFIGLLEPDGTLLEANETALSFGGIDRNDAVGDPFWEADWWQLSEKIQEQLKDAIDRAATGEFVRYEVDVQGEDEIMPIDFSIQPVTNEHGEVELLIPEGRDITERKEREKELQQLDELNTVIRNIERIVAQAETRDEIARTVCETLLEFDNYQFTVIGEFSSSFDDFESWSLAGGGEAYFDDILDADAGPSLSESLGATASKTGDLHAYQDLSENPHALWRDVATKHGVQSYAAIPLVYQDTVYGVIGLYADRPHAFDEEKQRVLSELGGIIGYALYALERKEVLDPAIELEFRSEQIAQPFLEHTEKAVDLSLDSVVPLSDERQLQYWTITGLSSEAARTILQEFPTVLDTRFLSTVGETVRYEVTADVGSMASIFTTFDGELRSATIDDATCTLVGEFPETVDPETVIKSIRETYPDVEFHSRRRILTSTYLRQMVDDQLTERQRTVLRTAYFGDFYGQPRLSTGDELADLLGITKQTFHQHLRKAEATVFRHLFDEPSTP